VCCRARAPEKGRRRGDPGFIIFLDCPSASLLAMTAGVYIPGHEPAIHHLSAIDAAMTTALENGEHVLQHARPVRLTRRRALIGGATLVGLSAAATAAAAAYASKIEPFGLVVTRSIRRLGRSAASSRSR
jgi:hypothetical protein